MDHVIQGIFTARKRSLGQGNVVTGVCLSTEEGGWLPSMHHRSHDQGEEGLHPGGVGLHPEDRGVCIQGVKGVCMGGLLSRPPPPPSWN